MFKLSPIKVQRTHQNPPPPIHKSPPWMKSAFIVSAIWTFFSFLCMRELCDVRSDHWRNTQNVKKKNILKAPGVYVRCQIRYGKHQHATQPYFAKPNRGSHESDMKCALKTLASMPQRRKNENVRLCDLQEFHVFSHWSLLPLPF